MLCNKRHRTINNVYQMSSIKFVAGFLLHLPKLWNQLEILRLEKLPNHLKSHNIRT